VIEDRASGVRAGVAAGMTVIGLCAESHLRHGHAEMLKAGGAQHIAASWDAVEPIVTSLLRQRMGQMPIQSAAKLGRPRLVRNS
jgi:beta-phosphoglucomutase-like phosphatase (HAD superfamily)